MVEKYIWQHENWPKMYWDDSQFSELLAEVNLLRGKLMGRIMTRPSTSVRERC